MPGEERDGDNSMGEEDRSTRAAERPVRGDFGGLWDSFLFLKEQEKGRNGR